MVLFFAWLLLAQADTLVLRDGTSVKGVWMSVDSEKISFLVDNQVKTYPRADVSAVTFGAETVPDPAQSVPVAGPANAPADATSEPETVGVIYLRDNLGKLNPLERNKARITRGLGETKWQVEGARSAVRLKYGQKIAFVTSLGDKNVKDFKVFKLVELESSIKKGNRRSPLATLKYGPVLVAFEATKASGDSYDLKPLRNLLPGEYAFVHRSNDFQCFGVDDVAVPAAK